MGRPMQVRRLWGTLKDKISVARATAALLSPRRSTSALRLAVLRATSHDPTTSPPPDFLSDLVLLCHHSSAAHSASDALLSRLRHTGDAFVALKCLISLHHLLPFLPRPDAGANKLLDLSDFRDQSNSDTWQLSLWARWFAELIDLSLSVSSVLGFPISSPSSSNSISRMSNSGLVRELGALVSMVEQMGTAPDSLQYQTIGLVYEVIKLAGEDYRLTMRELFARIREIEDGGRLNELDEEGLKELIRVLERLEASKEKMLQMFLNKKRNDGVWDAVAEGRAKAQEELRRRENSKLVIVEPTRRPRGGRWLDVDWNKPLTVTSTA